MRALAAVLLLLVAYPAAAQLHKCVDERGRTQYTDKPVPGCKPVAGTTQPSAPPSPAAPRAAAAPEGKPASKAPVKPPAKAGTKAAKGPAAKPYVPTAPTVKAGKPSAAPDNVALRQERAQLASRCKSMKEEHDWLVGPRGERVENRAARIDQVKRSMNACP